MDFLTLPLRGNAKILRNGNCFGWIKFGSTDVYVRNTCSFDAIVQLSTVAYLESEQFRSVVDNNTQEEFFEIISRFARLGAHWSVYQIRADLMSKIYPLLGNVISCTDNCNQFIEDHLSREPSIFETMICLVCDLEDTQKLALLVANPVTILKNGIKFGLQQMVCDEMRTKAGVMCKRCKQNSCLVKRSAGSHFFIEFEHVFKPELIKALGFKGKAKKVTYLDELPSEIVIGGNCYMLRGIISLSGVTASNKVGHYVAFCRRKNGKWEKHDDSWKEPHALKSLRSRRIKHEISTILFTK